MADIATNLTTFATRVATEFNTVREEMAEYTKIDDDNVSTSTTYSSSKIESVATEAAETVKDDLLNGAGEAYDTLKELADLITENSDAIDALETIAGNHVSYAEAQTLTTTQQAQARTNIDALGTTEEAASAAKLGSATVGGSATPVYLSEGTAIALSDTIGGTGTPVYLNAGTITACTDIVTIDDTTASTTTTYSSSQIDSLISDVSSDLDISDLTTLFEEGLSA